MNFMEKLIMSLNLKLISLVLILFVISGCENTVSDEAFVFVPKGLVDIRHVVRKFNPQAVAHKNGAEHLAREILGIKLDFKDDWKFHEKWESENLNENQIKYAANDVLTAMAIILKGNNFS